MFKIESRSVLGRFLSADTLVAEPGNPLGWDRYLYANANPANFNDPSGHMCSDPEDPTPTCENGHKYHEYYKDEYASETNILVWYMFRYKPTVGVVTKKFGAPNTFFSNYPKGDNESKVNWMQSLDPETGQPIGAHAGVDIYNRGNQPGTQLYAVAPGTVFAFLTTSTNTPPGYVIIIEHVFNGEKFYTCYFHVQADSSDGGNSYYPVTDLKIGDIVQPGDVIGHMGNTGTSDIHLHFEVRRAGGLKFTNGVNVLNTENGYWLSNPNQLNTIFVDISSAYGGYSPWYPQTWR